MVRLPKPGADDGDWGSLLNSFLKVAHNSDGSLKTSAIPNTNIAAYMGVEVDGFNVDNDTFTQIAFDGITAQLDVDSLSWDSGSPETVTVLQTGVYSVTVGVYWRDTGATGPILVQIISSCEFNFADSRPAIGDGVTESQQFLTVAMYLQSGQEINVNVQQSTGSTLATYIQMLVTRCA